MSCVLRTKTQGTLIWDVNASEAQQRRLEHEAADAFGAEAVGIEGVLLRKPAKTFHRAIKGLNELPALLT